MKAKCLVKKVYGRNTSWDETSTGWLDGFIIEHPNFSCDAYMLTSNDGQTNIAIESSLGSSGSQAVTLDISQEVYTTVSGWLLLSFISGHVLGRIVKTLGKR